MPDRAECVDHRYGVGVMSLSQPSGAGGEDIKVPGQLSTTTKDKAQRLDIRRVANGTEMKRITREAKSIGVSRC